MKENRTLDSIKNEVKENVGKRVILKADRGRKRIITREGVIEDAFGEVFTVRVNNDFNVERTVSYTYTDILTSTVKLTIC